MKAKDELRLTLGLSIQADCLDDVVDALAQNPALLDLAERYRGWVLQYVCEKNLIARVQARAAELAIDALIGQAASAQPSAPKGLMDLILIIPGDFKEDAELKAACPRYAGQFLFVNYRFEEDSFVRVMNRISELEQLLGAVTPTPSF